MGVGVNCQGIAGNAGECQGNVWEWRQSPKGMQENVGESRGIQGIPGECMGVGAKCQGTAGECRGMPGECMGVGVNCQGNTGNARECQGNICEWVYSARGKQGTTSGM